MDQKADTMVKRKQPKAAKMPVAPSYVAMAGKLLRDLADRECTWPRAHDDKGRHLFCAAPVSGNTRYCEYHFAMAIRPR